MDNPDITPEEMHERWRMEKYAQGWRYGETKSLQLKTHPCMVDYEDLPLVEKAKDTLFISIVKYAPMAQGIGHV